AMRDRIAAGPGSERPEVVQGGHRRLVVLAEVAVVAQRQVAARAHAPVQRGAGHAAVARQADAAQRRPLVHAGEAGVERLASQAEGLLPCQSPLQAEAAATRQLPVAAGTQAQARLPARGGERTGLQAEAVAAQFVEAAVA